MLLCLIMKLFLLALLAPLTGALNCDVDEDLAGVQDYSYTLAVSPDNMTTPHLNFATYGTFTEDDASVATVEAGYYTEEGELVYGVSIDCDAGTWTSTVSEMETGEHATFQSGHVTCVAGDWDLWLKVDQPFMMNWVFVGQPLQSGNRTVWRGSWPNKYDVTKPKKVPTKFGSHKGHTFSVKTSSSLDRFTFGKCVSYPHDKGCNYAREWVLERSKRSYGGLGMYGTNYWIINPIDCVPGTSYFAHVQKYTYPDGQQTGTLRHTVCCCVDMVTGKEPEGSECTWGWSYCGRNCEATHNAELYAEGEAELVIGEWWEVRGRKNPNAETPTEADHATTTEYVSTEAI